MNHIGDLPFNIILYYHLYLFIDIMIYVLLFFLCMGVSPTCMSVCVPCACNACGGMKAASDPLELDLLTIVN